MCYQNNIFHVKKILLKSELKYLTIGYRNETLAKVLAKVFCAPEEALHGTVKMSKQYICTCK